MDLGLNGKVVAVAAATAGLGLASARAFLEEGARVSICGRDPGRLAEATDQLAPIGEVEGMGLDLTEEGASEEFIRRTVDRFGRLDAVVTNSGGPKAADVLDLSDDDIQGAFELNLLVHVRLIRAALPYLRAQGGGAIVAITSAAVKQPIDWLGLSNTARSGLTGYLKTLSNRLAAENITVNSIAPGLHDTERLRYLAGGVIDPGDVPAKRLGTPEDFGSVVCFLASKPANYITGQTIVVDGGRNKALF